MLLIAKPTAASAFSPPLQKIVWLLSTMLPEPGRRTSLNAQISICAFSSSLQMIAVAHSGLIESALSFVVRTFQAPRISDVDLYGFRIFPTTAVPCGASAAPYAVV